MLTSSMIDRPRPTTIRPWGATLALWIARGLGILFVLSLFAVWVLS